MCGLQTSQNGVGACAHQQSWPALPQHTGGQEHRDKAREVAFERSEFVLQKEPLREGVRKMFLGVRIEE